MLSRDLGHRGSFRKQVAVLLSGSAAAQAIAFLSLPLITRLYTPDEMGTLSLALAFLGVTAPVTCLRLEQAILIAKTRVMASYVFVLCFFLVAIFCCLNLPLLHMLVVYNQFGFSVFSGTMEFMIMVMLIAMGGYLPLRAYSLRMENFSTVSVSVFSKAIMQFFGRVLFSFTAGGLGVLGLLLAETMATIVASVILVRRLPTACRCLRYSFRKKIRGFAVAFRRFRRFPSYEFPSVLMDQIAIHAPVPILAAMFGAEAAGLYAITRIAIMVPAGQVGRAVGDVMQARMANLIRNNELDGLENMFNGLLRKLFILGIVPMLLIIALAPSFTGLVLGEQWSAAGDVAAIIAPWLFAAFVVGSLSRVISVLQRQELKLMYDIFTIVVIVVAWQIADSMQLGMLTLVSLFTLANIVAYSLYLFLLFKAIREARGNVSCVG